jgi:hypothetical protein
VQFCSVVLETCRQYSRSGAVTFGAVRVHEGACTHGMVDATRLARPLTASHAQDVGAVLIPTCCLASVEGARAVQQGLDGLLPLLPGVRVGGGAFTG